MAQDQFDAAAQRALNKVVNLGLPLRLERFQAPIVRPDLYQAQDGLWVLARMVPGASESAFTSSRLSGRPRDG